MMGVILADNVYTPVWAHVRWGFAGRPRDTVRAHRSSDAAIADGADDRLPDVRGHVVGDLNAHGLDRGAIVCPLSAPDPMRAAVLPHSKQERMPRHHTTLVGLLQLIPAQ